MWAPFSDRHSLSKFKVTASAPLIHIHIFFNSSYKSPGICIECTSRVAVSNLDMWLGGWDTPTGLVGPPGTAVESIASRNAWIETEEEAAPGENWNIITQNICWVTTTTMVHPLQRVFPVLWMAPFTCSPWGPLFALHTQHCTITTLSWFFPHKGLSDLSSYLYFQLPCLLCTNYFKFFTCVNSLNPQTFNATLCLQVRKLRHKRFKWTARGHRAEGYWTRFKHGQCGCRYKLFSAMLYS